MKLILTLATIIVTLSSCGTYYRAPRPDIVICEEVRVANNHRLARKGFNVRSQGAGYPDTIRVIIGRYKTTKYRFTSIDEANDFLCRFVDDYLKPFNEEPRIRPYLQNFPMTAKNLEIAIYFLGDNGKELERPYIGCMVLHRGLVGYEYYDRSQGRYDLFYNEQFEKINRITNKVKHENTHLQ